jgi:hypothetical protein
MEKFINLEVFVLKNLPHGGTIEKLQGLALMWTENLVYRVYVFKLFYL